MFTSNSENKEENEDPFDPSPVPDMCPTETDRISDLPDVITSARSTESLENRSASPNLVCDSSNPAPEAMDVSEDQPNVLTQSGSSSIENQSVDKSASSDKSEIVENTDASSSDNKETDVNTESIVLDIDNSESTTDVEATSNVISYQSNIDQSVEEKRAEYYSKGDIQEANTSEDSSIQENQNVSEDNKEAENPATEMEQDTKEIDSSLQGLVDIPLDTETVEQTDNDNCQKQENTEVPQQDNISEQNDNNNHSTESLESSSNSKSGHVHIHLDNTSDFDSFQFWRTPLPQLDLELDLVDGKPQNIHVTARVKDQEHHKVYASEMNIKVGDKDSSSNLSDSMSDLTVCDKLDNTVMNTTNRSESVSEEDGVKIHKASVSSISDDVEGGEKTTGQTENTLTVIDGVVQGRKSP